MLIYTYNAHYYLIKMSVTTVIPSQRDICVNIGIYKVRSELSKPLNCVSPSDKMCHFLLKSYHREMSTKYFYNV